VNSERKESSREQPTLSVLISNYNHARYLPVALDGLMHQTHRPSEIIIIDDASTDNSLEVIEKFAEKEPLVRIIRNERNLGILDNLRKLLEISTSDYLYFMAADDMTLPQLFEKSMLMLAANPDAGLCSSLSFLMDEGGRITGLQPIAVLAEKSRHIPPDEAARLLSTKGLWIIGGTAIYRRKALLESGGFIPELGPFCDGFISNVIALRHGACFIPEPLAAWRQLSGSFAKSTVAQPEAWLAMVRAADTLMRTTYRDLFPRDFVDAWTREQHYGIALLRLAMAGNRPGGRAAALFIKSTLFLKYRMLRTWIRSQRRKYNFSNRKNSYQSRMMAAAVTGNTRCPAENS
jgi:glycosyltransferase involved in cell wall biosynthesis